jgi:hypothetical protein
LVGGFSVFLGCGFALATGGFFLTGIALGLTSGLISDLGSGSSTTGAGCGGGMGAIGAVMAGCVSGCDGLGSGPKNKFLSHFNMNIAPAYGFAEKRFAFGSGYATRSHGIVGWGVFTKLFKGK